MALDLARETGFAYGEADSPRPRYGSARLGKPDSTHRERNGAFARFLRNTFALDKPDIIVVEQFIHPGAQQGGGVRVSGDALMTQLFLHGVLDGLAELYGIRLERLPPATIRKQFCGRATADGPSPRGHVRSSRERELARRNTKNMVLARCELWGYVPPGYRNDNAADALAAFHVGAELFCGVKRTQFVLAGKLVGAAA